MFCCNFICLFKGSFFFSEYIQKVWIREFKNKAFCKRPFPLPLSPGPLFLWALKIFSHHDSLKKSFMLPFTFFAFIRPCLCVPSIEPVPVSSHYRLFMSHFYQEPHVNHAHFCLACLIFLPLEWTILVL